MAISYANPDDIQATIIAIVNANPAGEFSARVAADQSADLRYSDAQITAARRMAAARVLEAIGSNLAHPYWGELSDLVTVAHDSAIPPCFGEIGTPKIQPYDSGPWVDGTPASSDQIQAFRGDYAGATTFHLFDNPLNEATVAHDEVTTSGIFNPLSAKYSTDSGVLMFTGHACKIPMIQVPDDGGEVLAGTAATTSGSPDVVLTGGTFAAGDVGKRLIVTLDGTVRTVGRIQSRSTTSVANDTAQLDVASTESVSGASARTEDYYLQAHQLFDARVPIHLAAANVRIAIGMLLKEGDSLRLIVGHYASQGEVDLVRIMQGAKAVSPLDATRGIQQAQRRGE